MSMLDTPTIQTPTVGAVTNSQPDISGTGTPGAQVDLCQAGVGTVWETARVDNNGRWSVKLTVAIQPGQSYGVTARQFSDDGTASGWAENVHFSVNHTPVVLTPSQGAPTKAQPQVSGLGTVGATVQVCQSGTGALLGTAVVDGRGQWQVDLSGDRQPDQRYWISANQILASGETSGWAEDRYFTVLGTPVIQGPTAGEVTEDRPEVHGTGTPGAQVNLCQAGVGTVWETTWVDENGQWSVILNVATQPGKAYGVAAVQFSEEGIASGWAVNVNFSVSNTPIILIPSPGAATNAQPQVSGLGTPEATVRVCQSGTGALLGTAVVDGNGQWRLDLPGDRQPNQRYWISANQILTSGETSGWAEDRYFTVLGTPVIESPAAGEATEERPEIVGSGTPGALLTVCQAGVGTVWERTSVNADGRWSVILNIATQPGQTYQVTAQQHADDGTASNWAANVSFSVTDIPVIESPPPGVVTQAKPQIYGTGTPGATLWLCESGTAKVLKMVTVGSDGQWSVILDTANEPDKAYAIRAMQRSLEGKVSGWTEDCSFFVLGTPVIESPTQGDVTGTQPLISGRGTPGARLTLNEAGVGTEWGETEVDEEGNWFITLNRAIQPGDRCGVTALQYCFEGHSSAWAQDVYFSMREPSIEYSESGDEVIKETLLQVQDPMGYQQTTQADDTLPDMSGFSHKLYGDAQTGWLSAGEIRGDRDLQAGEILTACLIRQRDGKRVESVAFTATDSNRLKHQWPNAFASEIHSKGQKITAGERNPDGAFVAVPAQGSPRLWGFSTEYRSFSTAPFNNNQVQALAVTGRALEPDTTVCVQVRDISTQHVYETHFFTPGDERLERDEWCEDLCKQLNRDSRLLRAGVLNEGTGQITPEASGSNALWIPQCSDLAVTQMLAPWWSETTLTATKAATAEDIVYTYVLDAYSDQDVCSTDGTVKPFAYTAKEGYLEPQEWLEDWAQALHDSPLGRYVRLGDASTHGSHTPDSSTATLWQRGNALRVFTTESGLENWVAASVCLGDFWENNASEVVITVRHPYSHTLMHHCVFSPQTGEAAPADKAAWIAALCEYVKGQAFVCLRVGAVEGDTLVIDSDKAEALRFWVPRGSVLAVDVERVSWGGDVLVWDEYKWKIPNKIFTTTDAMTGDVVEANTVRYIQNTSGILVRYYMDMDMDKGRVVIQSVGLQFIPALQEDASTKDALSQTPLLLSTYKKLPRYTGTPLCEDYGQTVRSEVFDVSGQVETGVDPRTGLFHAHYPVALLQGLGGNGPLCDLTLHYSALRANEASLGDGWAFRFSSLEIRDRTLTLAEGQQIVFTDDEWGDLAKGKVLKKKACWIRSNKDYSEFILDLPSGRREILKKPEGDEKEPNNELRLKVIELLKRIKDKSAPVPPKPEGFWNILLVCLVPAAYFAAQKLDWEEAVKEWRKNIKDIEKSIAYWERPFTQLLPTQVISPVGDTVELTWKRVLGQFQLKEVKSGNASLFTAQYSTVAVNNTTSERKQTVTMDIWPDTDEAYRVKLELSEYLLMELTRTEKDESHPVQRVQFSYAPDPTLERVLVQLKESDGSVESVIYEAGGMKFFDESPALPRVTHHIVSPSAGQESITTDYAYSQATYLRPGSGYTVWCYCAPKGKILITRRTYNEHHLLVCEEISTNENVKTTDWWFADLNPGDTWFGLPRVINTSIASEGESKIFREKDILNRAFLLKDSPLATCQYSVLQKCYRDILEYWRGNEKRNPSLFDLFPEFPEKISIHDPSCYYFDVVSKGVMYGLLILDDTKLLMDDDSLLQLIGVGLFDGRSVKARVPDKPEIKKVISDEVIETRVSRGTTHEMQEKVYEVALRVFAECLSTKSAAINQKKASGGFTEVKNGAFCLILKGNNHFYDPWRISDCDTINTSEAFSYNIEGQPIKHVAVDGVYTEWCYYPVIKGEGKGLALPEAICEHADLKNLKLTCPPIPDNSQPPVKAEYQYQVFEGKEKPLKLTVYGYQASQNNQRTVLTARHVICLEGVTVDTGNADWPMSLAEGRTQALIQRMTLSETRPANKTQERDCKVKVWSSSSEQYSYLGPDRTELKSTRQWEDNPTVKGLVVRTTAETEGSPPAGEDGLGTTVCTDTSSRYSRRLLTQKKHGIETRWRYDCLGRITSEAQYRIAKNKRNVEDKAKPFREVFTEYSTSDGGTWVTTQRPDARTVRTLLDGLGREVRQEIKRPDGEGMCVLKVNAYDGLGNLANRTLYDYWPGGLQRASHTGDWQESLCGPLTWAASQVTDDKNGQTTHEDVLMVGDQQQFTRTAIHQQLPDGGVSYREFKTSPAGLVRNEVAKQFDDQGRLVSFTRGQGDNASSLAMTYDDAGRLVTFKQPDGSQVSRRYHQLSTQVTHLEVGGIVLGTRTIKSPSVLESSTVGTRCYKYADQCFTLPDETSFSQEVADDDQSVYLKVNNVNLNQLSRDKTGRKMDVSTHETEGQGWRIRQTESALMGNVVLERKTPRGRAETVQSRSLAGKRLAGQRQDGSYVRMFYNRQGQLIRMCQNTLDFQYRYTPAGQPYSRTVIDPQAGVRQHTLYRYDDFGQEVQRDVWLNRRHVLKLEHAWTANGQLGQKTVSQEGSWKRTENYTYDRSDRLLDYRCEAASDEDCPMDETESKPLTGQTFTWDALTRLGACVTEFKNGSTRTQSYTYDTSDPNNQNPTRLLSVSTRYGEEEGTEVELQWNTNGYLARDEKGHQLAYTLHGRLKSVSDKDGNLLTSYAYDGLNRLAAQYIAATQRTCEFCYDGDALCGEVWFDSDNNVVKQVMLGDDQVQQTWEADALNTTFILNDPHSGAVGCYLASHDAQPQWTRYGSFGENGAALPICAGYNGARRDPVTGCYHLGNGYRVYSPVMRRFAQPDSLSPYGEGGINDYAYCNGDGVNHYDPSGHIMISRWGQNQMLARLEQSLLETRPQPVGNRWRGLLLSATLAVAGILLSIPTGGASLAATAFFVFSATMSIIALGLEIAASFVEDEQTKKWLGISSVVTGFLSIGMFGNIFKNAVRLLRYTGTKFAQVARQLVTVAYRGVRAIPGALRAGKTQLMQAVQRLRDAYKWRAGTRGIDGTLNPKWGRALDRRGLTEYFKANSRPLELKDFRVEGVFVKAPNLAKKFIKDVFTNKDVLAADALDSKIWYDSGTNANSWREEILYGPPEEEAEPPLYDLHSWNDLLRSLQVNSQATAPTSSYA